MKKLRIATVLLVLAIIVIKNLMRLPDYDSLFKDTSAKLIDVVFFVVYLIIDVILLILGIITLGPTVKEEKEKAYLRFRYIYVMLGIFMAIMDAYVMCSLGKYADVRYVTLSFLLLLAQLTPVALLIICKPERPVEKVNLRDYDEVKFTSGLHRFIHLLLDSIFLIPIDLYIVEIITSTSRERVLDSGWGIFLNVILLLIFLCSYMLYCFISEVIFKQTFGKMVTRSCVVSDGVELSGGRLFLRSLCRYIPFDRLSFVFGGKWHDRLSRTAVVYVDSWERPFDENQQPAEA